MNRFLSLRSMCGVTAACTTLLLGSCINGYDDDWTFSSGVSGVTLTSPAADGVKFTQNPEGTEVTVEWPVVMGAGGYEFTAYNVDDPENPVPVGRPDTIDGCSKNSLSRRTPATSSTSARSATRRLATRLPRRRPNCRTPHSLPPMRKSPTEPTSRSGSSRTPSLTAARSSPTTSSPADTTR